MLSTAVQQLTLLTAYSPFMSMLCMQTMFAEGVAVIAGCSGITDGHATGRHEAVQPAGPLTEG